MLSQFLKAFFKPVSHLYKCFANLSLGKLDWIPQIKYLKNALMFTDTASTFSQVK